MCEKLARMNERKHLYAVTGWARAALSQYGWYLALAAAFLIPIKLTLGYFAIFPLVALWLISGDYKIARHPITLGVLIFALVAGLSGLFGIAPWRTSVSTLRLTLSLLAIPAVAAVVRNPLHLMFAAIAGQTIPSLVSILEIGLSVSIPRYFTGAVTESGQLALMIPLTVGILIANRPKDHKTLAALVLSLVLMSAALFLNAKRGPFFGCLIGIAALTLIRTPKLLAPLIVISIGSVFAFPQLHERLAKSAEHFFIAGGRNEMWSIGLELISRYPLGIGFHNSPYLQKFSVEVPPEHSHFHSNLINILVETGWLGLAVFLSWYLTTLLAGYRLKDTQPLMLGVLAAMISWQVAGLVEYNIGDSEVFVPMLIQIGGLLAMLQAPTQKRTNHAENSLGVTAPITPID